MPQESWSLLSGEGTVLVYIAMNPGASVKQIAQSFDITERTAWSIVTRLRRAGMLHWRREGHCRFYSVDLDGPFLHPTISGYTLRPFFRRLTGDEQAVANLSAHRSSPWPSPQLPP